MNIIESFMDALNDATFEVGAIGQTASAIKKEYDGILSDLTEETDFGRLEFLTYLEDTDDIFKVLKLVKNKKLSKYKIKDEIKKLLKDPEDLNKFLKSVLNVYKANKEESKKEESKEAMSSGAGVGAYSMPLFGKEKKKETKEATSSGAGVGAYDTPKIWAKSLKKKDWRGKSKPQIPGGKFVQVKKKCKKFPYCNQGDINALKIWENKTLQRVIETTSKKYGLPKEEIVNIIIKEIKTNKKN